MRAFERWFGFQPNAKAAVLIFHGFGLATKITDFSVSPEGLMPNLVAFIVGVEIGQLLALSAILILMGYWRRTVSFTRYAYSANVALMAACFVLVGYQLAGLDAMDRARSRGETLRFALRIPEFDGLRRQVRFRWIST